MAEGDASSRIPNIYRISQAIAIEGIEKKFRQAKSIHSTPFFCRHDPHPTIFVLSMSFGNDRSFSIFVKSPHQNVTVRSLAFTLRDHTGALLMNRIASASNVLNPDWGWQRFYKSTGSKCGTWRIVCDLEYEASVPIGKANPEEAGSGSSIPRINADLLDLLATSKDADVTFSVKGEEIRAHRAILKARSVYFTRMFESDMAESRSNEVEVMDTEPKVFRGMLEFLYSGLPPTNLSDIAMNLFSAADKYELHELVDLCESSISSNLTMATIIDALILADRHNRQDLLTRGMVAFKAHYGVLKESKEATDKLMAANPNLFLKLLEFWF